jgi:hypothetical protein
MFRTDIMEMSPTVIRVILYDGDDEVGVLFFERAKKTFTSKPISMNQWTCVDAKVRENIYIAGDITPKELVNLCQVRIREVGL